MFKLEFLLVRTWNVERAGSFTRTQLRWLQDIDCLDLVDHDPLIQQIASVQVLSSNPPDGPPIYDWRDVRGLFFTPGFPALQGTYYSLAALEILGGLDKIDREACIAGILKRHRGGAISLRLIPVDTTSTRSTAPRATPSPPSSRCASSAPWTA
jgi:hypothetical protein